jgi:hypothetical protein
VSGVVDVLPLATTATPKVRTRRIDSPRRWFDDLDESSQGIILLLFEDLDPSLIARCAVGDENHLAVDPSHSISLKGDGLNANISFFHHGLKIAWRRGMFNRF